LGFRPHHSQLRQSASWGDFRIPAS